MPRAETPNDETTEEIFLAARVGPGAVAVYLTSGVRLAGVLVGYDADSVFLCSHDDRASLGCRGDHLTKDQGVSTRRVLELTKFRETKAV